MSKTLLLVVNFGGPRNLPEVSSFLEELLTDEDVIRTPLPAFLQNAFFRRIARKRAPKVAEDYKKIGGKSPIFSDTNYVAEALGKKLALPVLAFHRYLRSTHKSFLKEIHESGAEEIIVFPLYPQFSYATTGSIARWFSSHVQKSIVQKMKWVKSYAEHPGFVAPFSSLIREFLVENNLEESETALLFSAHGVPVKFIIDGDVYKQECENSFHAISQQFPLAASTLAFQSKFGRGEWLQPSTEDLCERPSEIFKGKKHAVFIPLSFSSDHIETLFEIEELYVGPLRDKGLSAYRCPALGRREEWITGAKAIIQDAVFLQNHELVRD